jgi:NAD(P)-dependent dehydrogenase (short-subunit alcohol dehydrogenase family)
VLGNTDAPRERRPGTALVTGANSGLGKAIAGLLAKSGDRVILVARDRSRGEAARAELAAAADNPAVELLLADLSSQADVRRLAEAVRERTQRLDRLFNVAGTAFAERALTADGVERTLAVNHLAPFLLTRLLLPELRAAAPAHIVNIGTRIDTAMQFDDLGFERRRYTMMRAYAESKLGNIHFTRALATRLAGSGVTVTCVFPGVFRSNLGATDGGQPLAVRVFARLFGWALPTPERAARRVMRILDSTTAEALHGAYVGSGNRLEAPAQADDVAANERLWHLSSQLTGLAPD